MANIETIATIFIKILKVNRAKEPVASLPQPSGFELLVSDGVPRVGLHKVINIIILVLYRVGYDGRFLGVGGTWNLNEEKNPDVEIIASGVFVGYIIYTLAVLVSYCFGTTEQKRTLVDIIMNFSGCILWIAVGGTALHYWHGYQSEHKFLTFTQEREVGLALGSLCVIQGAVYLLDTVLTFIHISKTQE
uniref:Protein snakeskin n=1 Tax=Timema shepardi TaxID=629360 RepID=A0A7R9AKG3_TIMSH|nr:unnamed protein product [Timema shepardi]